MTGTELLDARLKLGELWGLGRPLTAADLGRLLRVRAAHRQGEIVRDWERGHALVPGPVACAVEAWLDGALPRSESWGVMIAEARKWPRPS